jgi:hypothetical protein
MMRADAGLNADQTRRPVGGSRLDQATRPFLLCRSTIAARRAGRRAASGRFAALVELPWGDAARASATLPVDGGWIAGSRVGGPKPTCRSLKFPIDAAMMRELQEI